MLPPTWVATWESHRIRNGRFRKTASAETGSSAPSARGAPEHQVGAHAVDVPCATPARVRSAELDPIAETERDGRAHGRQVGCIGGEGSTRRTRAARSPGPAPGWPTRGRIRGAAWRPAGRDRAWWPGRPAGPRA